MKTKQKENIAKHGNNLLAIFPDAMDQDPTNLCKKLRRMETAANRNATAYCNGEIDCEAWSQKAAEYKRKVIDLLRFPKGMNYCPVFVNGDPRGYSLKIDSKLTRANRWKIETDLGGHGLLAPEID